LTNFASLETSQTAQQSGHLKKTSLKLGGQISRLYQEKNGNLRNRTTSHGFFISGRKKFKVFFLTKNRAEKLDFKNFGCWKKEIGTFLLMFTQSAYVSYVHKTY